LPGILPDAALIRLRHLLQHTSGVHDMTRTSEFQALYRAEGGPERMRYHAWTPRELLAFVVDRPLQFVPGSSWFYSNSNYTLLGMVIERVTGNGYGVEIGRRVLRPLGLRHTRLPGNDPCIGMPHAHGYFADTGGGVLTPFDMSVYNPSMAGAAGELVSTTADLNRFFRALIGGRLLRPAQQRELLTAWPTQGATNYDYGLGLMTITLPGGTRLWGHRGDFLDAYYTESWSSQDGRRQVTVATTPWGDSPKNGIRAFLAAAFEG
jgi:D-alanyl-D-alanine carboxypeptidase